MMLAAIVSVTKMSPTDLEAQEMTIRGAFCFGASERYKFVSRGEVRRWSYGHREVVFPENTPLSVRQIGNGDEK